MKEETLTKIKNEYRAILDELNEYKKMHEEGSMSLGELKAHIESIKYDYLPASLYERPSKIGQRNIEDFVPEINKAHLANAITSRNSDSIIDDNNNIYFYYLSSETPRPAFESEEKRRLVPRGDKKEKYRLYVNVETGLGVEQKIEDCEKFEKENNVIILEKPIRSKVYSDFAELRGNFVIDAMENGQEEAVKNILKK